MRSLPSFFSDSPSALASAPGAPAAQEPSRATRSGAARTGTILTRRRRGAEGGRPGGVVYAARPMGRIFEKRKSTIFARNNRMAKQFTRIAREIAIAVKSGTPSPETNPALRRVLANARVANMSKDKIDAAIKRASGQDQKAYETILYEGYAPHGIALMIETATDNPQRTVANVRAILKDWGASFGQSGSVSFLFTHMGVFRLRPEGFDPEALELDLIDHGLEEMGESTGEEGERQLVVRCAFRDFGRLQAALEERNLPVLSAESEYVAQTLVTLDEAKVREVMEVVAALEEDDDVQRVFHNLG